MQNIMLNDKMKNAKKSKNKKEKINKQVKIFLKFKNTEKP